MQSHRGRHVEPPGQDGAACLAIAVARLAPIRDVLTSGLDELPQEVAGYGVELRRRRASGLDAKLCPARGSDEGRHSPAHLFAYLEFDLPNPGPADVFVSYELELVVSRPTERYEPMFAELPKLPGLFEGSQVVAIELPLAPLADRDDAKVSYCPDSSPVVRQG